jgi:hypothetical protein
LDELIWFYIKANSLENLETAHNGSMTGFHHLEQEYLQRNWFTKELHVCRAYTKKYANLGCSSTEQTESYNHAVKSSFNPQLTLEESTRHLDECVKQLMRTI